MDEELRHRLEAENVRLARKVVEDRVFATDEPIKTVHHIFKGVQDTVEEYNAEYVAEPAKGLIVEWKDPEGFSVRDGEGNCIELRLAPDRRSLTQVQYPTGKVITMPLSAHLDGHVFLDDSAGEAKPVTKVAGEILMDLLFPKG
jgi:hypothetical protein